MQHYAMTMAEITDITTWWEEAGALNVEVLDDARAPIGRPDGSVLPSSSLPAYVALAPVGAGDHIEWHECYNPSQLHGRIFTLAGDARRTGRPVIVAQARCQ